MFINLQGIHSKLEENRQLLDCQLKEKDDLRHKRSILELFVNLTNSLHKIEILLEELKNKTHPSEEELGQAIEYIASELEYAKFHITKAKSLDFGYSRKLNRVRV